VSAPRVAIVGARRARQGLGPFVARELVAAGAEVAGILGTSAATVELALRELRARAQLDARGYVALEELVAREKPDALAVLAPIETHEGYLERALARGLSVLCEKPLVWGGARMAERAQRLATEFARRGLVLVENCQWPFALAAFRELCPGALEGGPRSFGMHLTPAQGGASMLPECLPHPLSLLQALAPGDDARVEAPRFAATPSGELERARALVVEFVYRAGAARVEARVELAASDETPRRAGFGVNGCFAERLVRTSDYSLCLAAGSRWVDLPDPMRGVVREFVTELRGGEAVTTRAREMARRAEMLETLASAARGARL
jgi:predicted dehydrogenase